MLFPRSDSFVFGRGLCFKKEIQYNYCEREMMGLAGNYALAEQKSMLNPANIHEIIKVQRGNFCLT